jgi:hypothetical protein
LLGEAGSPRANVGRSNCCGRVADVAFQVTGGVTDEFLTSPATLFGFYVPNEKLTSVETAAIKDCTKRAVDATGK